MQTVIPSNPRATLRIDPVKAKRIAFIYAVYLIVPWPWDWVPVIGDIVDCLTFLVAYAAIKNTGGTGSEDVQ